MTSQKERWDSMLKEFDADNKTLEDCVKSLFKILDSREESDSGRVFNPTYISSCRVLHSKQLEILLPKMRELIMKEE
jgi:hypothetical protein